MPSRDLPFCVAHKATSTRLSHPVLGRAGIYAGPAFFCASSNPSLCGDRHPSMLTETRNFWLILAARLTSADLYILFTVTHFFESGTITDLKIWTREMVEDDLVDPLDEPGDDKKTTTEEVDDSIEDVSAAPIDNLDIEVVDEFDEDDFDEEFDDDFEEEIVGEYDLEDDQYGEDFDKEFGHLTDPTRAAPKKAPEPKKPEKKKK